MTLIDFQEKFATNEQCRQFLYEKRWGNGFICPKCAHDKHFNIKSRNLYQCKACNYQASVTAGTIMDKTRTPLKKWFLAIYLVAEDKRGVSALTLQKRIGVAYFTAWTMLQKIRYAMGQEESNFLLGGIVETDEAFFGAPTKEEEGGKRGRGTDKTPVIVSVSLTDDGKPRHVKMQVVEKIDGDSITAFAQANIHKGSEIRTDGLASYKPLAKVGYNLIQIIFNPKNQPEHLHWTHIVISNAKAFIEGTLHGLDTIHLQRYLDEFCYRFNRRWFESRLFLQLVESSLSFGKIRNYELVG